MRPELTGRGYGRQDSNLHGLRGAGKLATGGCPADPKSAVYANFTTPASIRLLDAHGTIGDNQGTYSARCSQGRRGGYVYEAIPLVRLGLGPLAGHGLCHSGTSHPLAAFRLTASHAALSSCLGKYVLPPPARRLELS